MSLRDQCQLVRQIQIDLIKEENRRRDSGNQRGASECALLADGLNGVLTSLSELASKGAGKPDAACEPSRSLMEVVRRRDQMWCEALIVSLGDEIIGTGQLEAILSRFNARRTCEKENANAREKHPHDGQ